MQPGYLSMRNVSSVIVSGISMYAPSSLFTYIDITSPLASSNVPRSAVSLVMPAPINIMTRAKWVRIDGKDLRRGCILTYTHTPHIAIAAQSVANHHEP